MDSNEVSPCRECELVGENKLARDKQGSSTFALTTVCGGCEDLSAYQIRHMGNRQVIAPSNFPTMIDIAESLPPSEWETTPQVDFYVY